MKNSFHALRLLLIGTALGAVLVGNSAYGDDKHPPNPSSGAAADPLATARAFQLAMTRGDAAAVRKYLDPQVLVMESGNIERSLAEYAAHHLPADLKYMSSVNYTLVSQSGKTSGALAWVASEAELSPRDDGTGSSSTRRRTTETLVLRKDDTAWRIIHIHWSSRKIGGAP